MFFRLKSLYYTIRYKVYYYMLKNRQKYAKRLEVKFTCVSSHHQYIKILLKTRLCCLIINMQYSTNVDEDYPIFSLLTEWLRE